MQTMLSRSSPLAAKRCGVSGPITTMSPAPATTSSPSTVIAGMLMQSRPFPWQKVAEERNLRTVRLALEGHSSNCAFALLVAMEDVEHSKPSQS